MIQVCDLNFWNRVCVNVFLSRTPLIAYTDLDTENKPIAIVLIIVLFALQIWYRTVQEVY